MKRPPLYVSLLVIRTLLEVNGGGFSSRPETSGAEKHTISVCLLQGRYSGCRPLRQQRRLPEHMRGPWRSLSTRIGRFRGWGHPQCRNTIHLRETIDRTESGRKVAERITHSKKVWPWCLVCSLYFVSLAILWRLEPWC